MYQLSSFLCKWMYRENAILEDDFETCQYGLLITIANIINFLIMLLVGVLCGTVWEMGMFYMVFISLRLFCGGYHAGSYGKCFLLFGLTCLLGMSGARCFSRYVFGSFCFFLVLAIFFGICIYKKAPVEHRNRLLSGSEKNCFKREGHRGARGGRRDGAEILFFQCVRGRLQGEFRGFGRNRNFYPGYQTEKRQAEHDHHRRRIFRFLNRRDRGMPDGCSSVLFTSMPKITGGDRENGTGLLPDTWNQRRCFRRGD